MLFGQDSGLSLDRLVFTGGSTEIYSIGTHRMYSLPESIPDIATELHYF